ncbi:alpha/beta fold hydrolase [Nonomuraea roseoviolacea]|uniref:Pimeloyl-ACP methyl ester carboxylesterase n=1 Tax=Nonomuraea roseoviolacea subsp. carminata TaxID=160689 RepID=A0ABT1K0F8_9ACTN|nr:alpha/beta hydrolase [Nonomuraea roseoviolacea]MCP2347350.1 pimeloyl-ACP methyl ester carboxylesterase [Nonomuraea roseoviolacea subsp. carminata]
MTTKNLTVDGARITYRTLGSGPALVLVHGTGPGSVTWDKIADRFADRNTVILPDLAGSDVAEDDGRPLTLEALTRQLAAVIEDCGQAPVHLVGHSLGAVIVLSLAATRPELVRTLLPLSGLAHTEDEYVRNTLRLWLELGDEPEIFSRFAMLAAFSRRHLNEIGRDAVEELAQGFRPHPNRMRQIDLVLRVDIRRLLPRIQAPTLVVGATRDALVPVENALEIHAAIPGSSYAEVDTGHVSRAERPDDLVRLIRDFTA